MKKIKTFILAGLLVITSASAQMNTDQQGAPPTKDKNSDLLPVAGDIAIGITAAPFLQYLGNILNNTNNNAAPALNFLNGNTIFAKYFLEDDMAVRARLGIQFNDDVFRQYVDDELAQYLDPLSRDVVVDERKFSRNNYVLGLELELRRGYNRLQGYYGGGLVLTLENSKNKYNYGNTYSEIVPDPATANFGANIIGNTRVLETSTIGNNWGTGLNGFVGVEYFILPKISIGGELGLALIYTNFTSTKQVVEYWDGFQVVEETTLTSPGDRHLRAFTLNPALGLYFMFHF